jgi:hypothetical protein
MNILKNKLWTLAAVLVLLAVLGRFYAVPAIAQAVRAALVQDRDNPARQPFSALVSAVNGMASSPAVAAGKRLVVTGIDFNILAGSGLSCGAEVVAPGQHSFHDIGAIAAFLSGNSEEYSSAFDSPITVDTGQLIQVNFTCGGNTGTGMGSPKIASEEAAFHGYLIDIP